MCNNCIYGGTGPESESEVQILRLSYHVTIFFLFEIYLKSFNFASLDLRAQKELDNVPGHFGKFRVYIFVFYFFMSHMSSHMATFATSTATRRDVFRKFQNVTNFDVTDVCHQKHADNFRDLSRKYHNCIIAFSLCFLFVVLSEKYCHQ